MISVISASRLVAAGVCVVAGESIFSRTADMKNLLEEDDGAPMHPAVAAGRT